MDILLGVLLAIAALMGGALLAVRFSVRTGVTIGFLPWLACFIGALVALKYTPLLAAAYGQWAEVAGILVIMFVFGVAHGLNVGGRSAGPRR
ncbi:MAG TPA: hypothetical protein V6D17_02940 [Candidatus Obscuribacterales bacterium]